MSAEYTTILEKIEAEIRACLPVDPDDAWMHEYFGPLPCLPLKELRRAMNAPAVDLVRRGGKRWRPLLTVYASMVAGAGERALPLAPLVELPHNGSLILDDIEDSSDFRRGEPAVHVKFGEDIAINAGCLLYFLPIALIDRFDASDSVKLSLHRLYGERMRRLHLGQAMDITWHRDPRAVPSREQYDLMTRMKTGVLARFSFELGLVAAGMDVARAVELSEPLETAGVAFQILDDVKNLETGNPGKKRGDDVVEGKRSLPFIVMCEKKIYNMEEIFALFLQAKADGVDSPAIGSFIDMVEASGALQEAKATGKAMLSEAIERCLGNFQGAEGAAGLEELLLSFMK